MKPYVGTTTTCPECGEAYVIRTSLQEPGGLCAPCRNRLRVRALYNRRADAGLCVVCGQDGGGRRVCRECASRRRGRG